jgi:hypothetical protein
MYKLAGMQTIQVDSNGIIAMNPAEIDNMKTSLISK